MISVDVTEFAKRFDEFLDRANQGEQITVLNGGEPFAVLGPAQKTPDPEEARAAVARLRNYARAHPIANLTAGDIRSWIEEGRP